MKDMICAMKSLACVIGIGLTWTSTSYAVPASFDDSNPSVTTQFNGNQGGFVVNENVSYDPNSGPWIKQFVNVGGGIGSGMNVPLTETFFNSGTATWTDWHEEILSTTMVPAGTVGGGGGGGGGMVTVPGFLFRNNGSLVVKKNGAPLIQGTDYTRMTTDYMGSFAAGGPNWGAIWILFEPSGLIHPGQTLTIEKQIFEVFEDSNIWMNGEYAEIQQYPTVPEPSSLILLAAGATLLTLWRRWSVNKLARREGLA